MKQRIGFIGLGAMGRPMARNLCQAGYPVTVWNRTPGVEVEGATVAASLAELAAAADIIITMLRDGQAVAEVVQAIPYQQGQVHIEMSTIAPHETRALARQVTAQGVTWLDAPVAGSVGPAEAGQLVILVGGPQAAFATCSDLFSVLGKASYHFGEVGQGAAAKLVVNAIMGAQIQAIAEGLTFANKAGLDRAQLLDMLGQTAIASPMLATKAPQLLSGDHPSAFALALQYKDLGLAVQAAHDLQLAMPVIGAAHQTFAAAVARGLGQADMAAILQQLEDLAGI